MNIIIRLFSNTWFEDIPLYKFNQYSIGSKTVNGYTIPQSDLMPEHIKFINNGTMWSFKCNGSVYFNRAIVDDGYLSIGQMYILSKKYRISMLVLEEYTAPANIIDILSYTNLSFGKSSDNNIVLGNTYISRKHFTISNTQNRFFIYDNGSTNGTFVNGKKINSCELNENDEIVAGGFKVKFIGNKLYLYGNSREIILNTTVPETPQRIPTEKILFKRSPRLKRDVPTGVIEIQSPPSIGQKPEMNWLSILLPAIGTISISVAMSMLMGRNPSMLAFTVPMTVIGLIVSVTNYYRQNKKHAEKEQLRTEKYTEHLNNVVKQIENKQAEQRKALILAAPETSECFNIIRERQRRLWDRRPSDSDFIDIRVGSGSMPFSMDIKYQHNSLTLDDDPLKNKPQEIYNKYKDVSNLPITCPILNFSTCGIVGNRNDAMKLINNMLVQIATHHCYTEVKTVIVYDESETNELGWTANLPHCYDEERKTCFIAKNKDEASKLFSNLEKVFKERVLESEEDSYGVTTLKLPYFLFVISTPRFIERETIQRFLFKNDIQLGVGSIFLFDRIELLPQQCNMIIEVKNSEGRIYHKERASEKQKFIIDRTSTQDFHWYGEGIKNIYCEEMTGEIPITKKITLFEVLGIQSTSELDLSKRWRNANVTKTLAAPLGVKEKNELVYLDLHEEAHGPHGLVAGTTGSGKSEVLQSYILSVATLYHPYEISFFLIDFKGGGMANQFVNLPHLIGAITDLENSENAEKEIKRSLLSIRAELNKRKRLFEKFGVNKIDQYIELYKNNKVDTPLPHLIIIVDEFAELKAQQPDFMNELVSAARIGRSLGVHLILATQKPSGQVSEQIWTNSKFKLCLKVADANDSNEVIKSPVAAKITNPGRAYLRVENSLELFQSGYSGAKIYSSKDENYTELNALVDYINDYCTENNIKKLDPICLPMLDDVIPYDSDKIKANIEDAKIPFGIYDNPSAQVQDYAYIDINQNTFIVGSARTGKTNLLQGIIRTLSNAYTPEELNMYIMDFGSMTLKNFESLCHVGGVVLPDEDEKLKNLLKLLVTEIENRKKKTISVGVSSYSAYVEGGYTDMPRIILMLDNFYSFKEMYEDSYEDIFADICKNGLAYGISVIVTNSQTGGFNYKHLKSFADKIAFYCNESGEYYNLFDAHRISVDNIPGRALYRDNNNLMEVQTFLAFDGDKEIDRTRETKLHIDAVNKQYPNSSAKKIPCVPEVLTMDYINSNYDKSYESSCILGLEYENVQPTIINIKANNVLTVLQNPNKNSNSFIENFVYTLSVQFAENAEIYLIDDFERELMSLKKYCSVHEYITSSDDITNVLSKIEKELYQRYTQSLASTEYNVDANSLIVLVINSMDAIETICKNDSILQLYNNITTKYKSMNGLILLSGFGNINVSFGSPEIIKQAKENKNLIFFEDLSEMKFIDLPFAITKKFKKKLTKDEFYYINNGEFKKIKGISLDIKEGGKIAERIK